MAKKKKADRAEPKPKKGKKARKDGDEKKQKKGKKDKGKKGTGKKPLSDKKLARLAAQTEAEVVAEEARMGTDLGPAFRAKAEGRGYNVKLARSAYVPKVDDQGKPISKIAPYLPVVGACSLCPARCCRLNVKVSLPDAVRFCNTLGVPFFSGLTFVPSDHQNHAFLVERDDRIVPEENGWNGKAEIQLRRQESGACHALVDVGGYERCGVYDARPSLCRLYPMTWTSDVAKGGPEAVLCPIPYGYTEADERRFIEDVEASIDGWEIHDDIVQAWNEASVERRSVQAFLEFALPKTAERLGVELTSATLSLGFPDQRLYRQMVDSKVLKAGNQILAPKVEPPWAGLSAKRSPEKSG